MLQLFRGLYIENTNWKYKSGEIHHDSWVIRWERVFMTCRSGLQNNSTDEKGTRNAFDSWLKRAISE